MANLFGGVSDEALGCAFVAGLSLATQQALWAGARIEDMSLTGLLQRARALLVGGDAGSAAIASSFGGERRPG